MKKNSVVFFQYLRTNTVNMTMSDNPEEIRLGVFPCSCGVNIAGVLDMDELVRFSKTLPNVIVSDKNLSL
jgi:hypothetical protein